MAAPAGNPDATAGRRPIVAIVPWGDVFTDWLDGLGITPERFRDEFTGSWMFAYAAALRTAGVDSVFVCVTERVSSPVRWTHAPTGLPLVLLPAPRAARILRRRVLRQLAPWAGTPVRELAGVLRGEQCDAVLVQEYETGRFDLCVALGRRLQLPIFGTFQGGDYHVSRLERTVRGGTLRRAAGLIVATHAEAERLRGRYGDEVAARVSRIFNPVDVDAWRAGDRAAARAELGLPADAAVVAWHGQVDVWRKGLDLLLRAHPAAPGARLVLLGTGADAERLRALAQGAEGVLILDEWADDRERIRTVLSAADVYAFPSRHEGFALAPLEAMACGLPVVAAEAQGVRDVLERGDEHGGVVVSRDDVDALRRELAALLGDPERRRRLGEAARRRVEETCSPAAVGRQLRAVLVDGPSG